MGYYPTSLFKSLLKVLFNTIFEILKDCQVLAGGTHSNHVTLNLQHCEVAHLEGFVLFRPQTKIFVSMFKIDADLLKHLNFVIFFFLTINHYY